MRSRDIAIGLLAVALVIAIDPTSCRSSLPKPSQLSGIQGSGEPVTVVGDPGRHDAMNYPLKGPYWITDDCADRWQVFGPGPLVCRVTTVPPRFGSSTL